MGGIALAGGVWFNQWKSQEPKAQTEEDKLAVQLRVGRQWANRHLVLLPNKSPSNIPALLALRFSHNSKLLASSTGITHVVRLWDAQRGALLRTFTGHRGRTICFAFSEDDKTLASASSDGTVRLWDVSTGKLQRVLRAKPSALGLGLNVREMSFSPDGKTLRGTGVTAHVGFKQVVWDMKTGNSKETLIVPVLGGAPYGGVFSPASKMLASARQRGKIEFFDTQTGKGLISEIEGYGNVFLNRLIFSPSGRMLAAVASKSSAERPAEALMLWDAKSGRLLHTFDMQGGQSLALCFSPDNQILVAEEGPIIKLSSSLYVIKFWNVRTGKLLHSVPVSPWFYLGNATFSADGKRLAVGGDGPIEIWKMN